MTQKKTHLAAPAQPTPLQIKFKKREEEREENKLTVVLVPPPTTVILPVACTKVPVKSH
jgi:hypothetical protein